MAERDGGAVVTGDGNRCPHCGHWYQTSDASDHRPEVCPGSHPQTDQYADVLEALSRLDVGGGTQLGAIIARKVVAAVADLGYALVRDDGWHFVTFDEDGWFIEHSVACRQAGTLGTCDFNRAIREIADKPDPDLFGRHRITEVDSEGLPSLERADA